MPPRKAPARKAPAPAAKAAPAAAEPSLEQRVATLESQLLNLARFIAAGVAQQLQHQRAAQQSEAEAIVGQVLAGNAAGV